MSTDTFEKGRIIRAELLGEDYVRKALDEAGDFDRDFQEYITECGWGRIWGRPGLTRKQRSLLNLGMLTCMGRLPELELHVGVALRNGLTKEEIKEVFIQVAGYCGIPAALEGQKVARKVIEQAGV
ncbi:MAG: carboxymuconolactone decarboxylase family protein [Amphiplicatus sp.]